MDALQEKLPLLPFSLQAAQSRELEKSCEIKVEGGSSGPSIEVQTPPVNLCNLHNSEK